mgnify:CR=1 FL=1
MSTQPIFASLVTSLDEFKKHPQEVVLTCGDAALAVLDNNRPVFYVVSPQAWALLQESPPLKTSARSQALPLDRFDALAAQVLLQEEQRAARGDLSTASLGILRNRLDAHVLPFFRFVQPSQTTADVLEKFVHRLQEAQLSSTTVSQYLVVVRKLLKLAIRRGVLAQMPEWPSVRIVNRPRAMLALREYAHLVRTAYRLSRLRAVAPEIKAGDGTRAKFWVLPRHRMLPPDMAWVMRFMVNCFLRPGDVRQLRHKHVEVCRGHGTLYLRLSLPETKRHDSPVVSMRAAVRVYESARAHAQAAGLGGPEDYVFLPEEKDRDYALAVLGFWFKWVVREAGLPTHDQWGRARTLYCLRHTAIMFRLLYGQGIDVLTLARNARTSVQMIERFYASALDGEMNVGMLQSRRIAVRS